MPDNPGSCAVAGETFYASGDSLWFSGLANQPEWRDPDSPDGIDPNYQTIDGRFLGMTEGIDTAYSMMILRFILPDASGDDYLWRVIFGDWPGSSGQHPEKTRVIVQVTERDTDGNPVAWRILGLENGFSIADVGRGKLKGKQKKDYHDYLGLCSTFIDYDIRLAQ